MGAGYTYNTESTPEKLCRSLQCGYGCCQASGYQNALLPCELLYDSPLKRFETASVLDLFSC
jgi:hypothetical protein